MFTGLVSHVGEALAGEGPGGPPGEGGPGGGAVRLRVAAPADFAEGLAPGASVAVDGCCLTLSGPPGEEAAGAHGGRVLLPFDVSPETAARTTLAEAARLGRRVNLERALAAGDPLGGHLTTGHIDGTARLESLAPRGDCVEATWSAPGGLAPLLAPKGSVAVDGVSLTINGADGPGEVAASGRCRFSAMLIPSTLAATTLGERAPGSLSNLEIDLVARYLARARAFDR